MTEHFPPKLMKYSARYTKGQRNIPKGIQRKKEPDSGIQMGQQGDTNRW